jgi:hypothetical protein
VTDEDEDRLADLLLRWEELRERGQDTAANELCQDQPRLIEELSHRIKALKATSWLDEPIDLDNDGSHLTESSADPRIFIGRYRLDDLVVTEPIDCSAVPSVAITVSMNPTAKES